MDRNGKAIYTPVECVPNSLGILSGRLPFHNGRTITSVNVYSIVIVPGDFRHLLFDNKSPPVSPIVPIFGFDAFIYSGVTNGKCFRGFCTA